jgi:hypothetical protein
MALHAKKTHKQTFKDVLLVESPKIKRSHLKLIHDTVYIHSWNEIHEFISIANDEENLKPSLRKTLTRKLKTKPVAKQIYSSLLASHLKKENAKVKTKLKSIFQSSDEVELNLLTQTLMNPALMELFPKAKVNYFEHGLGDYHYISEKTNSNFICLFSEEFKKYLLVKKINPDFISQSISSNEFEDTSISICNNFSEEVKNIFQNNSPSVLILMESVEMYNVKQTFWTDYLEKCLAQIQNPEKYFYFVKPHPVQSIESIEITKSFFKKRKLKYSLLQQPALTSTSVEVLFPLMKKNTSHVFALFSSSLFYLSKLYPEQHITYHYSYEFMEKHISNAPEQYKQHFLGLEDLIKNVFSGNCKEFI